MYDITIPQRIKQIIVVFNRSGMWRREDEIVSRKIWWKLAYLIFHMSFVTSMAFGGFLSHNKNDRIFLVTLTVSTAITTVKLFYILWRNEEILAFIHDIGAHSVRDRDEFIQINRKINKFMKFASCFIFVILLYIPLVACLPMFTREKSLPINVAFPFDWKNSKTVYWMAYAYVMTGMIICIITVMLNIVVWYLMMNCSIKYQILGNQFRNMFSIRITTESTGKTRKTKEVDRQNLFRNELISFIEVHRNIRESINRFKSCFSDLFFAQITTSGICVCGAVYVLAFSSNKNVIENTTYVFALVYHFSDIFMIMYFGNEIKLLSDGLSYCLFESNWIDKSKSCKKFMIILSEVLKQPHQLIIGKLYSLDLETFIGILNLAYSMFNILRNLN